jgi:hypothetical protein
MTEVEVSPLHPASTATTFIKMLYRQSGISDSRFMMTDFTMRLGGVAYEARCGQRAPPCTASRTEKRVSALNKYGLNAVEEPQMNMNGHR